MARIAFNEAIEEERKRLEKEKEFFVKFVNVILERTIESHPEETLLKFLSELFKSGTIDLDKKFRIARTIVEFPGADKIKNQAVLDKAMLKHLKGFKTDIFNPGSQLFSALNYQRNVIPITFFGSRAVIGLNYAKSLQDAQSVVRPAERTAFRFS
ncbi:MAG: hypothetical protein P4M14_10075 [Gammaproteobacteria bacterium]|nr:hypothetical protein [Gammaproteobacteria bacterium]